MVGGPTNQMGLIRIQILQKGFLFVLADSNTDAVLRLLVVAGCAFPSLVNFQVKSETRKRSRMRLLTHNMLSSNIKGVTNGFPLLIEAEKVVEKEVELNADFLGNMFAKIEWKALVDASKTLGYGELPDSPPEPSMLKDDEFLHKFHHALLELHLEEGALVCPETGRKFPVNKGIPNMLLHEDEV